MRKDRIVETGFEQVDGADLWDCFAGPVALLDDDRHPASLTPFVLAARTLAFTTEMNAKIIRGMVREGTDG